MGGRLENPVLATLPREHRIWGIAWAAVTAGLLAVLGCSVCFTPEAIESGLVKLWPACPYRALFDRECPTCGMTRGFAALAHGRLEDAGHYNRASPYAAALVLVAIGVGTTRALKSFRLASGASR